MIDLNKEAEEFLTDWMGIDNSTHPNIDIRNQWLERKNQLINFAKLHCEAQLKAILENVKAINQAKFKGDCNPQIDADSIINAYDLNQMK